MSYPNEAQRNPFLHGSTDEEGQKHPWSEVKAGRGGGGTRMVEQVKGGKMSDNVWYPDLGDGYKSVYTHVKMYWGVNQDLCILLYMLQYKKNKVNH